MKQFFLMIVAIVIGIICMPVGFLFQLFRTAIMDNQHFADFWWAVAIGIDQLGGSIMYGEPDWTVSSRTFWLRRRGNKWAARFEKIIDFMFGKKHCEDAFKSEFPHL